MLALVAAPAVGGLATPAVAAASTGVPSTAAASATAPDKATILASWTQPTPASYQAWDAARQDPMAWLPYQFDWSTDLCSGSPDTPLGFDFRMPCWRHDFGYRNYKALGDFAANKPRIDQAFYHDLRAVCDKHQGLDRANCLRLAKTYFTAVDRLGRVPLNAGETAEIAAPGDRRVPLVEVPGLELDEPALSSAR